MYKSFVMIGLVMLTAAGCKETISSANLKTKGISATITVVSNGTSSTVQATLQAGGDESNTYVSLDGGDTISASAVPAVENAAKASSLMTSESTGVYRANLPLGSADTVFSVLLDRVDDTDSTCTGTLPTPFEFVTPPSDKSRASDDLVVTWDKGTATDPMAIRVEGDCIFSYDKPVSDTGSFTIAKGELKSTGSDKPQACDLTVTVERSRKGSVDASLDSESSMTLIQRRSATFKSAP